MINSTAFEQDKEYYEETVNFVKDQIIGCKEYGCYGEYHSKEK